MKIPSAPLHILKKRPHVGIVFGYKTLGGLQVFDTSYHILHGIGIQGAVDHGEPGGVVQTQAFGLHRTLQTQPFDYRGIGVK